MIQFSYLDYLAAEEKGWLHCLPTEVKITGMGIVLLGVVLLRSVLPLVLLYGILLGFYFLSRTPVKGYKKLQDLFIDEKVPRARRGKIPLLLSQGLGIIWVCGVKRSDTARAKNASSRLLKIEIKKN